MGTNQHLLFCCIFSIMDFSFETRYFSRKSYQYFINFFALMPIAIKIDYLLLMYDSVKEPSLFHV